MKNNYKAVFFDLDGTLADTDLMIVMTMAKIFEEYRPEYKPTLKELISFSGPPLSESMLKFFPKELNKELVSRFRELSPKLYDKYVKSFPGVKETLSSLKNHGIHTAVITSKMREPTIYTLKMLGIYEYFDVLICVDDVKKPKPDPEGMLKALDAVKLSNEDVLYVGDTYTDYVVANECSVDCALVGWGLRGVPKEANPNYVLKEFKDLEDLIGYEK